ncbi:MAG: DUF6788 family protein [Thermoanaerobaculia bacterium]
MDTIHDLEARRSAILREIQSIRSMKRGSISEQHLKVRVKARTEPVLRGPYYVLSRREGQKTVSERLTSTSQLEQARRDVAAHKRFVVLCQQFERLTEQLGLLEHEQPELVQEKKRPRSRSKKTGK